MSLSSLLTRRLSAAPNPVFMLFAALSAFAAYLCMYAFRKPFTAGAYAGLSLWGVQFKIVLVIAQVAGYALSKFIGIRVISGLNARRRGLTFLLLIGVAELALLGFALTPFPWNAGWLFVNGLPLGMIWGIVFSYLEGRRNTEVLAAALSINFIISSGFVKTVGRWLLDSGISEWWMPVMAGLLFAPLLLLSVWLLERLPKPSDADIASRAPRPSMTATDRRTLFLRYAPGLLLLTGVYLLLTIVRDVRDNFAVEIWADLGYAGNSALLTTAELPVAILTLLGIGGLMVIRDNFKAFQMNHALSLAGALLLALSTLVFQYGQLSPLIWMISSGFGLFLPYVIFNGVLFDRFLATFRERGNVGFLMYIADAVGYLGSVGVLLWRNFGAAKLRWLDFYTALCYGSAALIIVLTALSWRYFIRKKTGAEGVISTSYARQSI